MTDSGCCHEKDAHGGLPCKGGRQYRDDHDNTGEVRAGNAAAPPPRGISP
ncbi:hypothetical protein T261_0962 [Streptomyces lydicus]|nr:hypothetical protein T261_0962 [Streptomyces lydicus]